MFAVSGCWVYGFRIWGFRDRGFGGKAGDGKRLQAPWPSQVLGFTG